MNHQKQSDRIRKPQTDLTQFAVILPIIDHGEHRSHENAGSQAEIDTMLLDVETVFSYPR